ncbi:complement C1q tumor necrosis factor-related protein 3-like [Ruditapes philippinarum]|uniref:complement C1q tumor necrosis factor-related protein 3-like n=1 Tax=Ruditapes philippinarum TaxID=129788 RepID=UPI00295B5457|nr:complement C1q tumor necrosis factor-related protein 3-like [Ruditapes philippinarum]
MYNHRIGYKMFAHFCFVGIVFCIKNAACDLGNVEPVQCVSRFDYNYKVLEKLSQFEREIKELKQMKMFEDSQKVAFIAQLSVSLINPAVNTVVVFDRVSTNAGNGYNSGSGMFVAPVNGLYSIHLVASSRSKATTNYLHLYIMHNSSQVGYIFLDQNSDYSLMRSTAIILQLSIGDTVFVKIGNKGARGHLEGCCFHTVFSGFLIN